LANDIIKFLNNRTKEQLKDINVNDRTNIIIDAKKVLTKRRLMQNVENRLHEMTGEVASSKIFSLSSSNLGCHPLGMGMETYSHKISIKRCWRRAGIMTTDLISCKEFC
jgi:hypothetical protein